MASVPCRAIGWAGTMSGQARSGDVHDCLEAVYDEWTGHSKASMDTDQMLQALVQLQLDGE